MGKRKVKTFMDTLMVDKEFREKFDREYQNLCISEQIESNREKRGQLIQKYMRESRLINQQEQKK